MPQNDFVAGMWRTTTTETAGKMKNPRLHSSVARVYVMTLILAAKDLSRGAYSAPAAAGGGGGSLWTPCENVCGDVPVMYPFGTSRGCGSKAFEKYVNCSKERGTLVLYTPTGEYSVKKIDYANNVMVVSDPSMSTCAKLVEQQQNGGGEGFGLPVGSPFEVVAGNRFLLLGCSESALVSAASTLCDAAATPICAALYASCPAVAAAVAGGAASSSSSCCVYSAANAQQQQPFQLDLPLLQCAAYSSVYAFGADHQLQNPTTWSYGIALKFFYDQSLFDAACSSCQRSRGACAYNVYGFVCVCSAGVNTTTDCFGTAHFSSAPQIHTSFIVTKDFFMQGLVGLLGTMIFGVWI